jgi:hypothetical protein
MEISQPRANYPWISELPFRPFRQFTDDHTKVTVVEFKRIDREPFEGLADSPQSLRSVQRIIPKRVARNQTCRDKRSHSSASAHVACQLLTKRSPKAKPIVIEEEFSRGGRHLTGSLIFFLIA